MPLSVNIPDPFLVREPVPEIVPAKLSELPEPPVVNVFAPNATVPETPFKEPIVCPPAVKPEILKIPEPERTIGEELDKVPAVLRANVPPLIVVVPE